MEQLICINMKQIAKKLTLYVFIYQYIIIKFISNNPQL